MDGLVVIFCLFMVFLFVVCLCTTKAVDIFFRSQFSVQGEMFAYWCESSRWVNGHYNMTMWILAGNYISFTIAAGLIRLHMPGVKISRV